MEEAIRNKIKSVGFLRYHVYPAYRNLQLARRRRSAELGHFDVIDDMKAEAERRGWDYQAKAPAYIQRTTPSGCLPEDVLKIVSEHRKMAGQHDRRREDHAFLYDMMFARPLSVRRFPIDETFTCDLPMALVGVPHGPVFTDRLEALPQSSRLDWRQVIVDQVPDKEKMLRGQHISLLAWSEKNYGHWLVDTLTRMSLIDDFSGLRVLVRGPVTGFRLESLQALGIAEEQIVALDEGWYWVENLRVSHAQQRSMIPHRDHLMNLRARLLRGLGVREDRQKPWRRIYVSRNKSRRKILNEEQIMPVLANYGFERVYAEELSFGEQARLFSETEVLLGAHGTGMNNQVFCDPGAMIVELYNPVRYNTCVCGLAGIIGHGHWFMYGQNANALFDMTVDPRKLDKLLSYAFDEGTAVQEIY